MFRIKLLMIVGGIVLVVIGVQEWRLAQEAKETPQTISCADLSTKGPGDNANVVLSDVLVCDSAFVYEAKKNNPKWNMVWVPLVPSNGEYVEQIRKILAENGGKMNGPLPNPQNIKVLLKSKKIPSEAELTALANQPTVSGLVTNKIESLGKKQREILEQSYPGTDFTRCWIIDHDRKPAGMGQVAGFAGGGVLLSLVGLGMLVAGNRSGRS